MTQQSRGTTARITRLIQSGIVAVIGLIFGLVPRVEQSSPHWSCGSALFPGRAANEYVLGCDWALRGTTTWMWLLLGLATLGVLSAYNLPNERKQQSVRVPRQWIAGDPEPPPEVTLLVRPDGYFTRRVHGTHGWWVITDAYEQIPENEAGWPWWRNNVWPLTEVLERT